ncbi:MAG: DNA polymerase III subunit delta [Treponemataceae bacterium]
MNTAWLFTGPEIGQKKQRVEKIKQDIGKKYGQAETHIFYAYETSVFEVLNLLQSISLFASPNFVQLRNAELIKDKNEIAELSSWIKNSSAENLSFLVLESDEISINKKLENAFASGQKQIFWEMFENKKQDWIRNFFAENKMSITNDGIDTILDLVENNTDALKNVCQHLILFFGTGKKIEADELENLLSHNKEESVFSLFDTMTFGDAEKTFDILSKLVLSKNFSAVQFIIGLTYCFRKLNDIQRDLIKTGERPNDFNLRKFGVVSKKAKAQYTRALRLWSEEEVRQIILLLTNCDFEIRKSGQALQNTLIEITVLKIAKKQLDLVACK